MFGFFHWLYRLFIWWMMIWFHRYYAYAGKIKHLYVCRLIRCSWRQYKGDHFVGVCWWSGEWHTIERWISSGELPLWAHAKQWWQRDDRCASGNFPIPTVRLVMNKTHFFVRFDHFIQTVPVHRITPNHAWEKCIHPEHRILCRVSRNSVIFVEFTKLRNHPEGNWIFCGQQFKARYKTNTTPYQINRSILNNFLVLRRKITFGTPAHRFSRRCECDIFQRKTKRTNRRFIQVSRWFWFNRQRTENQQTDWHLSTVENRILSLCTSDCTADDQIQFFNRPTELLGSLSSANATEFKPRWLSWNVRCTID